MDYKNQSLINEILDFFWQDSPISATFMGIHKFDSEIDLYDKESRQKSLSIKESFYNRLQEALNQYDLGNDEQIDLALLKNNLYVDIEFTKNHQKILRDATVYPQIALSGCFILMIRDFAPIEERSRNLLARLKKLPRLMQEGKDNLSQGTNIPQVWTEMGIEITESGLQFFQQAVPNFAVKTPELKDELIIACNEAVVAFEQYLTFLKEELLPRSDGRFALGQTLFQLLLDKEHMLPYTTEKLLELGNEQIQETQEKLYKIGRLINSTVSWKTLVKECKTEHPESIELINTYKNQMEECLEFIQRKELVSIPENQTLSVTETPAFERHTIPYAAYLPPAPFEDRQEGLFWVTPVNTQLSPEQQEEQLKGHSNFSIPITAAHEGYPGHHLQFSHANKNSSLIRRILGTNVFIEGWALYCEELMWEQGFYTDPKTRLLQLKDILWRACRVVIDVQLHTGEMTIDDAVKMLVETALLEKENAISEVKRYSQSPTQPMSYLAGKLAILDLRNEYKKVRGEQFNLKEFHDRLLSFGSLPIQLIRDQLLKN